MPTYPMLILSLRYSKKTRHKFLLPPQAFWHILAMSPFFTSLLWNKLEIKIVFISHSYKFLYIGTSFFPSTNSSSIGFLKAMCSILRFLILCTNHLTSLPPNPQPHLYFLFSVIWHNSQITILQFFFNCCTAHFDNVKILFTNKCTLY
jgi:hypothetical protein